MIKFNSAEEMLKMLTENSTDLYNLQEEIYLFGYNDRGSICEYSVDQKLAEKCAKEAGADYYWGGILPSGGAIYDGKEWYKDNPDEAAHDFPDGIIKDKALEYCKEAYTLDGWMTLEEFTKGLTESSEEKSCSTCKYCYHRNNVECCQVDDHDELCIAYSSWERK